MEERDRAANQARHATVLVAEADALARDILIRALRGRFAAVAEAASGGEALALFDRLRPELAVVAARLPDMAGASLAAAMRAEDRRIPIFLTGLAEDILAVLSSLSLPGLRPIVRPFDPALVADALEEAALDLAARRSAEDAWGLVKFFLDESPHPSAILHGGEAVSVNRALLRFMGLATFYEFKARRLTLERFLADPPPAEGVAAWVRGLPEDRLDREHRLRLVNPDRPDQPPQTFQAAAARLPGRDRYLLTLTDITELELERRELLDLANLDPLTRVLNRRKLQELLADELARVDRYATPLAVLMLDIDHFKAINDTHGHDSGDAVLVELAGRLVRTLRQVDRLARFGGEEFVVVAPGIGLAQALDLAERLRLAVAERDFAAAGRVTASFGVAAHRPRDTAESLLKRADEALYRAKRTGRNKVEPEASPQPPSR